MQRLIVPILALLVAGTAGCKPITEARVKAYLYEHPELLTEIAYDIQAREQQKAINDSEAKVPQYRQALERDPRDFVANPNGVITVVEFFDYRCGYCRQAMPSVMSVIERNRDVRFVFKEYPILSPESRTAAAVALAAQGQGDYLLLHQKFYASHSLDGAAINAIIAEEGLDPAAVATAASSPEILKHLNDTHALANALGINGTPTFIVAGKLVVGSDGKALEDAIAEARRQARSDQPSQG